MSVSPLSSFDVRSPRSFSETLHAVEEELQEEGFGILTRADVHTAFAEKLGKDFRPYVILGACNPALANAALTAHPEIGLMLPCNVVVEQETEAQVRIRIIDPAAMMQSAGLADDPVIAEVGQHADERLRRVAAALEKRFEAPSS